MKGNVKKKSRPSSNIGVLTFGVRVTDREVVYGRRTVSRAVGVERSRRAATRIGNAERECEYSTSIEAVGFLQQVREPAFYPGF